MNRGGRSPRQRLLHRVLPVLIALTLFLGHNLCFAECWVSVGKSEQSSCHGHGPAHSDEDATPSQSPSPHSDSGACCISGIVSSATPNKEAQSLRQFPNDILPGLFASVTADAPHSRVPGYVFGGPIAIAERSEALHSRHLYSLTIAAAGPPLTLL